MWGSVEGRPRGCARLGARSRFFHLCHQVSAAELRCIRETTGADTRAHAGLPFSRLGVTDPTGPSISSMIDLYNMPLSLFPLPYWCVLG